MKFNVHLPKTPFPMKADLPLREPDLLSRWDKLDVYRKMLEKNAGAPLFVLHDGPPYANGPIHVGHALNKILKDVIVKFASMSGLRAPFIPGWDCHGLPIEHQLMKEKGWNKRTVERSAFRKEATRYAEHWIDVQRREFKRLGLLGDWDHPYKTLSPDYEAGIAETFYDLVLNGDIAQDLKPVHWCPHCETALAEAEIEYEEKTSASVFTSFPVDQWPDNDAARRLAGLPGKKVHVLVWTTTPWTLPANVALAFHPEGRYRIWESPLHHERLLVGDPGWAFLEGLFGGGSSDAPSVDGRSLEGLVAKNPLNNNDSRGIVADFVSVSEGTGVVHIAPGHGEDDYVASRSYGLPVLSPVDERGRFTEDVLPGDLRGQSVWEANVAIIDRLSKDRRLVKETKVAHSYPHCWRCKNPILFRAARQWFLKVGDRFRASLLKSVDQVRWIPDYGKERILGMLKTRPDWCLSRQRLWGTPIPMFLCSSCGEPLRDPAVFKRVVESFRAHGSGVWYEKAPGDFGATGPCAKCGHSTFKKEEDILDVWFDSGVSWVAVLGRRPETAGTTRGDVMYLEGSDQHRGWFQTSLLPAVALTGAPPYASVLTHGFVLDGQGRAMSKSLGNVIAPQELVQKYGADILRLWVSVTDYREDVRLSQDIVDRVIDAYRKIRNTLRFLLGNLGDFSPSMAVPLETLEVLDAAALSGLNKLIDHVTKSYNAREFHMVTASLVDQYCINTLSEYYLDVRKDVLYCDRADSHRRRSAQTALWHIARALTRALAPMLSFTAEEAWQTLSAQGLLTDGDRAESVFLNPFPREVPLPRGRFFVMADFLKAKRFVNEAIEKARQAGTVKSANDASVRVRLHEGNAPLSGMDPDELASVLGVAHVRIEPTTTGDPFSVVDVSPAPGAKCSRCWVWRDISDGLCSRCRDAESAVSLK